MPVAGTRDSTFKIIHEIDKVDKNLFLEIDSGGSRCGPVGYLVIPIYLCTQKSFFEERRLYSSFFFFSVFRRTGDSRLKIHPFKELTITIRLQTTLTNYAST